MSKAFLKGYMDKRADDYERNYDHPTAPASDNSGGENSSDYTGSGFLGSEEFMGFLRNILKNITGMRGRGGYTGNEYTGPEAEHPDPYIGNSNPNYIGDGKYTLVHYPEWEQKVESGTLPGRPRYNPGVAGGKYSDYYRGEPSDSSRSRGYNTYGPGAEGYYKKRYGGMLGDWTDK